MTGFELIKTLNNRNTTSEEMNRAITEFEKRARRIEPISNASIYGFTYLQAMSNDGLSGFVCEYSIYDAWTYSDVIIDAYCDVSEDCDTQISRIA